MSETVNDPAEIIISSIERLEPKKYKANVEINTNNIKNLELSIVVPAENYGHVHYAVLKVLETFARQLNIAAYEPPTP